MNRRAMRSVGLGGRAGGGTLLPDCREAGEFAAKSLRACERCEMVMSQRRRPNGTDLAPAPQNLAGQGRL